MTDWVADGNIAQVVAAGAQVVATIASVAGLVFVGRQIRGANKTSDLRALYDFAARAEAIEARLNEAPDDRVRTRVRLRTAELLGSHSRSLPAAPVRKGVP